MAKLPWGPFEADKINIDQNPWSRLLSISQYLEDGEPIPSDLARWLGTAIHEARQDPGLLLEKLDLKKKRGKQNKYSGDKAFKLGERIHNLITNNRMSKEKAIEKILLNQSQRKASGESISRSTLQRFLKEYQETIELTEAINSAEITLDVLVRKIYSALQQNPDCTEQEAIHYIVQEQDTILGDTLKQAQHPPLTETALKKMMADYKKSIKESAHKSGD